jgi:uncharacterized protein YukE
MDAQSQARGAAGDPLWAEVVDWVICDGRPGYLRDAADRYEHLLRRMHDEATTLNDELSRLAQRWEGTAWAAYQAAVHTVVEDLRLAADEARGIADAVRLAAELLRAHQERIPVPVRLGGEVFRAHQQRRETAGGVAPSNADFERAVYADIVERAPWLAGPQALEQANALFQQQQNVARRIYRHLSAAYGEVEALLPAPLTSPAMPASAVVIAPEETESTERSEAELVLGGDDDGDGDGAGVVEPAVPAALGGQEDDDALGSGGILSGSGTAGSSGSGPGSAGGPGPGSGQPDSGAAFGTPVSVMSTPSMHTGMGGMNMGTGIGTGMDTGTHLSTHMGAGHGGVIGGTGEGDTHSTWLTGDDDPFEQDGQSSGAVLT